MESAYYEPRNTFTYPQEYCTHLPPTGGCYVPRYTEEALGYEARTPSDRVLAHNL